MKKKLVMLSLAIVLALSGCGNDYIESEVELQTKATQEEVAIEAGNESENEAEAESETEEVIEQAENKEPDNHDGSTFTDWKIIQPYDDTYIKYRIPDDYAWYPRYIGQRGYIEEDMDKYDGMWARDIDVPDEEMLYWSDLDSYYVSLGKMNTSRYIELRVYEPESRFLQTSNEVVDGYKTLPYFNAEILGTVQAENTTWELVHIIFYATDDSGCITNESYRAVDIDNLSKSILFGSYYEQDLIASFPDEDVSSLDCNIWTEDEVREFLETCVY